MRRHPYPFAIVLIALIALAPLLAACSPFGGDDDDDGQADADLTPTLAAGSPTAAEDETPEADGAETPPKPVPGDETPEGTAEGDAEETPEPEGTPAGTPEETPEQDPIAQGATIYANVCAACHQPQGEGIEGIYPALAGNQFVTLEDPAPVIEVLLVGRGGMPRFGDAYSDEELAGIITYIRSGLGENDASEVEPSMVHDVRESIQETDEGAEDSGGDQTDDDD